MCSVMALIRLIGRGIPCLLGNFDGVNVKVEDSNVELEHKCRELAAVIQNARSLVVYTGAGISTVR